MRMTKLYFYGKAVAKLSKVYGVSKQTVRGHFDDMNIELFYQIRKAYGREYPYYLIKQSDIEECRHWLGTHKDELAKVDEPQEVEKPRNSDGYTLDNHKDEPLHFNTQREVADFLGYKATGFVIGKVYRGYEIQSGVPESEPESQPLDTTVDSNDNSMYTQKSFEEDLDLNTEVELNETIANDSTSTGTEVAELPMSDIETDIKSDFEAKVEAYIQQIL